MAELEDGLPRAVTKELEVPTWATCSDRKDRRKSCYDLALYAMVQAWRKDAEDRADRHMADGCDKAVIATLRRCADNLSGLVRFSRELNGELIDDKETP